MTEWIERMDLRRRELTLDEHEATEYVLSVAEAWAQGDIPLHIALTEGGGLNPHTARGLAMLNRRSDPRLPHLERMSLAMSNANGKAVMNDGTCMNEDLWDTNEFNVRHWQLREGGF